MKRGKENILHTHQFNIGDRFGKLKLVKILNRTIGTPSPERGLFRCDCGNEVSVALSYVAKKSRYDCGCGKAEEKLKSLKNQCGSYIRGLQIVNVMKKNRIWYMDMKCFCGNIFEASLFRVKASRVSSCGCLSKRKKKKKPKALPDSLEINSAVQEFLKSGGEIKTIRIEEYGLDSVKLYPDEQF